MSWAMISGGYDFWRLRFLAATISGEYPEGIPDPAPVHEHRIPSIHTKAGCGQKPGADQSRVPPGSWCGQHHGTSGINSPGAAATSANGAAPRLWPKPWTERYTILISGRSGRHGWIEQARYGWQRAGAVRRRAGWPEGGRPDPSARRAILHDDPVRPRRGCGQGRAAPGRRGARLGSAL